MNELPWRLPNVKELPSIVNYENAGPSVSSEFNVGCVASCTVLTSSCTEASGTWSSSTYTGGLTNAWFVQFNTGIANVFGKSNSLAVRAVRGGL